MSVDRSIQIGIIVDTLLQVGGRVLEISRGHVVTNIWDGEDTLMPPADDLLGKRFDDAKQDAIFKRVGDEIEAAFVNNKNRKIEYTTVVDGVNITFRTRILVNHPDKEHLFMLIEKHIAEKSVQVVEDRWKLALDASGDGMWELNVKTNAIYFSDKWHEIFGYEADEVKTGEEWAKMIHPDDLPISQEKSRKYLAGEAPSYTCEIRYRCKDGSWKWILSRGVVISRAETGEPLRFIGTHTDINDRKLSEERYASTAQLLAKLINNLQTGIIVTDEHNKVIFANDLFREMYEKDENPSSLEGLDMMKNLGNRKKSYKDPERFETRTMDIFKRKEMVLNEEWETLDGRIILRDYIPLAIGKDNKGGIWKFTDVTRQRNIDKQLEEQRLFYERVLNSIPADIAVFDNAYRYMFVNKNAFKNDDLRKWMIGKTDIDYAQYSNRPYSFVERRKALYEGAMSAGKEIEFIERLVSAVGDVSHHLRLVRPVYFEDGSLEFLMAYGVQVTELIQAQEQLKTSIDTFSSAFNHSGIGMALLGLDGRWIDVNNVLCDLTGYTKGELLQRTYHDITYGPDDEMDRPLINKLLTKEISTYTVEKRYVSKDKKIVLVSLTVSLVWNEQTPKFFVAQVVDITQRKELENDIKRKNMELEATRISLVNKISQLEELSHIIAHNLRGPAGNVKMFSEVLQAKRTGNGDLANGNPLINAFTEDELVKFINESSVALIASLSTLMEITEIKLNKTMPATECDIAATVNGIVTQLQSIIFEKNARITLDLEVEAVTYPKVYLENILYNLISNALKYSNTGVPPEISIFTRVLKNKRVQLIVKDNGLGIDLEKFGNKVFKLNQIFHSGYDSKGVGLYITKTQVESLGGSIDIKSKVGEGCEFTVTL